MAYIRPNYDKGGKIRSYTAEIYLGRDHENKKIIKYVTRKLKRDVEREAKKIELEHHRSNEFNVGKKRVVDWFAEYLKLNTDLGPGTVTLYEGYLKNHYKPFFRNTRMEKVTGYHLKRFQSELLKTLARSTVNRIMSALSGSFTDGLKDKTPFKDINVVTANKPDVSAPSDEEFARIWDAVRGSRYEIPVLLAAWNGFRRAEILALRENDMDFENNTIRIDESWTKSGKVYIIKTPKSERGFRTERVPEELMNMIKKMISDKKIVELNPTGDAFLWNIRPDTFSTSYRNFLRRRNAPAYTFHELRHYQATWMFNQGFPDKYAARRMGQTEEVLRSTYQHLGLKKKEELDEKVVQITKAARK